MAIKFNRSQTFATNGTVDAPSLHNLVDSLNIYQSLITDQTNVTSVSTADELLIAIAAGSSGDAPKAVTVQELFQDALTAGTYTNANISEALTYGTATGTRLVSTNATITTGTITTGVIPALTAGTTTSTAATITSGTITNLASTSGTVATLNSTTGTIATLNSTTGTIATLNSTTGTIATLNSTTGTIATLNSTTGTIATLNSTTPTFLGAITASTNTINVGSGQIYKDATGNVGVGTSSPSGKLHVSGGANPQIVFDDAASRTYGIGVTSTAMSFYDVTGAVERMRIDSSGGVTIAGLAGSGSRAVNASAAGLLSAASDASLKEEVVGAHIAGLNEILQIHPKMYRWKDDIANRGENASIELGFIANDVAPIIPSAAPMGNDGLYGFYDRSITAALVKAVQEIKTENDSLKSRIEALEAK